jgi:hypothetical protein
MKNSNKNTGKRTRDLPSCRVVPEPTVPPRDDTYTHTHIYIYIFTLRSIIFPKPPTCKCVVASLRCLRDQQSVVQTTYSETITSLPVHIFVTPSNCFQKHPSFWRFPFSNAQLRHSYSELLCFRLQVTADMPNDVITELSKIQVANSLTWERQKSPLHKSCSSDAH